MVLKMSYNEREPWSVVMGRDWCSEGHLFESHHGILDGNIIHSHIFVLIIVMFFEKTKINK